MDETAVLQRLQRVTDDLEIRRVITDYAAFIDARAWDRLVEVFADEVIVEYHNGRTRVQGAHQAVEYIVENTAHLAWQHHFVSPYGVEISGDTATAQAYLVSHQTLTEEPGQVLMMAGLYDVSLTRGERGWQVAHMVHTIRVANFLPITTSPPGGAFVPSPVRH